MPKTLGDWLHYSVLKWQMPGVAYKAYDGNWHRYEGELPGWSHCGKWLSDQFVFQAAGRNRRWRNPWASPRSRTYSTRILCPSCFADEIRLLDALRQEGGE